MEIFYSLDLKHRKNLVDKSLIHVYDSSIFDNTANDFTNKILLPKQRIYHTRNSFPGEAGEYVGKENVALFYECSVFFCNMIVGHPNFYNKVKYEDLLRFKHLFELKGYELWCPTIPDIDREMESIVIDRDM